MNQEQYDNILKCIAFGMPARANELIKAFNITATLANERLEELKALEETKKEIPVTEKKEDK